LYEYQNKGVAGKCVRKSLKTKEIMKRGPILAHLNSVDTNLA
jgi:hypothetical protein